MTARAGFLKSGHLPTLVAALLYFDVSFMVWVLLGPLAPFLREEFTLSATEQGLIVAIPLLGGAFFRPVFGMLADRIGGRRAGLIGLSLTAAALIFGWNGADSVADFYTLGFLLGIAGASFSVALPLASRWYPPHYQGLAMGIAGAGNSGTVFATLCVPRLAERFGWPAAFGIVLVPLVIVLVAFAAMAKDSPSHRPSASWRNYLSVIGESDTLWFAFLYSLTFGGFVGFASFLTTFFHEQYHLTRVAAGDFATVVVLAGSLLRPVGGWLSDRFGGYRLLLTLLSGAAICIFTAARLPSLPAVIIVLFLGMGLLGMGNGAVFQLVPQRFGDRIGIVTGVVGAAGGLGGFFLPSLFGLMKDMTGSYAAGLLLCGGIFLLGALTLLELGVRWTARWQTHAVGRTGLFSYRAIFRNLRTEETT
jgi:MFS transporter, NNP family, nitrate/nitrite transporter